MDRNSESFITISDLYRLCFARWRWFVVVISAALFFAVCYLIKTPFLYTRKAVVMVREESMGKNTTEKNGDEFSNIGFVEQKNNVNNVIRHYKSLDVLIEVAHRLDSTLKDGYLVYKAEEIQSRLTIENEDERSTILDITYRDYSTPKAAFVLSLILQVYKEKWIEGKRQATLNTSQFIDSRLELLEHELDIVDDSIAHYKSRYGITDLGRVSDLYLQQQSSSDAEILRLTNQKSMAEFIRGLLEHESSEPQLLLVNSGINNSILEAQISLYNSLLMQLQSHQNYTSSQNPLILNQEKELDALRKRILENIKNHIHTIDIQLSSLTDYYDEVTSKVISNPSQAKHFIGFLGPVTVIFLRASFDNNVRDRHDVERHCEIPFLGEVPYSGSEHSIDRLLTRLGIVPKTKSSGIVVGQDMLNASNEAFRVLRNNMDASFAGKFLNEGGRSYLIKSTQIEVGKTFVAMNLALIRAIGGERVLFIDGDLRQASASRLWCTPLLGLTDYLNGDEEDYRKLLFHPKESPMLDVLPTGALPTNPTELLKSPLLEQLLLTAKAHYDCIFIDSPTSGMLADADIIERAVDCTIFVIRAGHFNRNLLNEISQVQATNSESKLQYIILNGVSIDARYGYTYLHKYERSEKDKNTVEISPKTILLNKIIFKKKHQHS